MSLAKITKRALTDAGIEVSEQLERSILRRTALLPYWRHCWQAPEKEIKDLKLIIKLSEKLSSQLLKNQNALYDAMHRAYAKDLIPRELLPPLKEPLEDENDQVIAYLDQDEWKLTMPTIWINALHHGASAMQETLTEELSNQKQAGENEVGQDSQSDLRGSRPVSHQEDLILALMHIYYEATNSEPTYSGSAPGSTQFSRIATQVFKAASKKYPRIIFFQSDAALEQAIKRVRNKWRQVRAQETQGT